MAKDTLLEKWRKIAYNQNEDKNKLRMFWNAYFETEKGIYERLLANPDEEVKGTVVGLAEKYGIRKGNRIKYTERGEEKVEHIYEVDAIYPHCVLLRDIFDNTRICPCYGKLRMMLNEIE